MWLFWGPDPSRIRCDVPFTEAINQRMQVPSRLRVTDSFSPVDEELVTEEESPSVRMHIPDRISLAGDVLGCFLGWLKVSGVLQHPRE